MKLKISNNLLRKIIIGTTIFNCLLLVAYVCLLISATLFENYVIFIISIPAYIISDSWLLIIGLFGFESLLLLYYWIRNKNEVIKETEPTPESPPKAVGSTKSVSLPCSPSLKYSFAVSSPFVFFK